MRNVEKIENEVRLEKEDSFDKSSTSEVIEKEESKETGDLIEPIETGNDFQDELREKEEIERLELKIKETDAKWIKLFRKKAFVPFSLRYNWILYKVWRKKMIRGIGKVANKWKNKVRAVKKIQSFVRMISKKQQFFKEKTAAMVIQRYWHKTRPLKKELKLIRNLVRLLVPIYK